MYSDENQFRNTVVKSNDRYPSTMMKCSNHLSWLSSQPRARFWVNMWTNKIADTCHIFRKGTFTFGLSIVNHHIRAISGASINKPTLPMAIISNKCPKCSIFSKLKSTEKANIITPANTNNKLWWLGSTIYIINPIVLSTVFCRQVTAKWHHSILLGLLLVDITLNSHHNKEHSHGFKEDSISSSSPSALSRTNSRGKETSWFDKEHTAVQLPQL